jgi:hypothetical protein
MHPGYVAGSDAKRPKGFYRDFAPVSKANRGIAQRIIADGTWSDFVEKYRSVLGKDCGGWVPSANSEWDEDRAARLVGEYLSEVILREILKREDSPPASGSASSPGQQT